MRNKFNITKDELYDLYIVQNLSLREIGTMFNVSADAVNRQTKKYEIKKSLSEIDLKRKQTNLEKYGCVSPSKNKDIQNKRKQTNLERYGCENPAQSQEVKNKIKNTNLERYGCETSLQSEEIKQKVKQANLEKYGYEYPIQNKEIQEKRKQANLEKYGCEYVSQLNTVKEKVKQTNLKRYGCEYPIQSKEIQNKIKQTNLERYGCENPAQSEEIKQKVKQTNLERYGCENPAQSQEVKNKIKNTNLERYGCETSLQSEEIQNKRKQTNLERYGCENPAQSQEIKDKVQNKYYPNILKYLSSKEVAEEFIKNKYSKKTTILQFSKDTNISYVACLKHIHKYNLEEYFNFNSNISQSENDIIEYLKSKGIKNIIQSERTILDGKEIDIYLPDYNVGIEFNGDYWHSELNRNDKRYHYNKSILALSKGVFLYHIFSHEWTDIEKRIRILDHLCNILHLNENKIYARKCIIKEVSSQDKNIFLEENHIQGKDNSAIKLGLYYNDELVSLMTFCKPRFSKKYTWELSRFCSKHGYNIVGGASKLINYFINHYMNGEETIVSYSDIAKTQGKIYDKLNFKFIEDSDPNYIWWKSDFDYKTRYQCQMKNEKEIMSSKGYVRVYDCGNKVWVYKKETRS